MGDFSNQAEIWWRLERSLQTSSFHLQRSRVAKARQRRRIHQMGKMLKEMHATWVPLKDILNWSFTASDDSTCGIRDFDRFDKHGRKDPRGEHRETFQVRKDGLTTKDLRKTPNAKHRDRSLTLATWAMCLNHCSRQGCNLPCPVYRLPLLATVGSVRSGQSPKL